MGCQREYGHVSRTFSQQYQSPSDACDARREETKGTSDNFGLIVIAKRSTARTKTIIKNTIALPFSDLRRRPEELFGDGIPISENEQQQGGDQHEDDYQLRLYRRGKMCPRRDADHHDPERRDDGAAEERNGA